jgi:hypothetical protein
MSNDSSALNRTSFEGGKYNIDVDIEISDTKLSEKGMSSFNNSTVCSLTRSFLQGITSEYLVCLY